MPSLRTHYDNLKVARNAPLEVIRAAYRTLSQKYHPDRRPGDQEAVRIMCIINEAYAVLSDPERRREHDAWIAAVEGDVESSAAYKETPSKSHPCDDEPKATVPSASPPGNQSSIGPTVLGIVGVLVIAYIAFAENSKTETTVGNATYAAPRYAEPNTPKSPRASFPPDGRGIEGLGPTKQTYVRAATTPNGEPWPVAAMYIDGYDQLNTGGLSTVIVDNTKNDSDVFVKLVALSGAESRPVRVFFIPSHQSFKLASVREGTYDVRYRDLDSGALARSEPFQVDEVEEYNGVRFSEVTMTLYKVSNGNMRTYVITEQEF